MDTHAVRAAIRELQASAAAEIESLRPLHPGESDEQIAAFIWFERQDYNLMQDYTYKRQDLSVLYADVLSGIRRDQLSAAADEHEAEGKD